MHRLGLLSLELDPLHFVTLIEGVEAVLLVHLLEIGVHGLLDLGTLPLRLLLSNDPLLFLLIG